MGLSFTPYGSLIREEKRLQQEQFLLHSSHSRHWDSPLRYFGSIHLRWTQKCLLLWALNRRIVILSSVFGMWLEFTKCSASSCSLFQGLLWITVNPCVSELQDELARVTSGWGIIAPVIYPHLTPSLTGSPCRTDRMVKSRRQPH